MKVVFIDIVHKVLQERLEAAGFTCVDATHLHRDQIHELLTDAAGMVIRSRFPMDTNFLKYAPQLKFIARSGAGMENIDIEGAAA